MKATLFIKVKSLIWGVLPFCLFTFLPGHSQEITRLTPGRTPDGLVYFLPKTAVRINLLVEKKTFKPGRFAKYADKYLRLPDVEQEEQVTYRIADCSLTTFGIRDTSKCYTIRLKGGYCETAEVKLSDDGVLQAINAEPAVPIVRPPFRPAPKPKTTNPQQYLNAEALSASTGAKMAELTAQQLQELQEQRQQLITGEADEMPQDELQLKRMLQEIDNERQALITLFTGTVTRDTTEHVLIICPDKPVNREVVFRLSSRLGLVDKDDLSGIPFYLSVENLYPASYGVPDNKKMEGFLVNMPGMARLTLFQENMQLASFDIPFAQFGLVELREVSIFKRYVTHMRLNPSTGAVDYLHADTEKK